MIPTLVALSLVAAPAWTTVKANGFTFEMPSAPELSSEEVTWATTGKMKVTRWTAAQKTGDQQLDMLSCFESGIEAPRLIGLLHDNYCKAEKTKLQFDKTDATTQARECLWVGQGPDRRPRKALVKILGVGPNVCALTSSTQGEADQPSAGMRRFVDSLKLTGKQTVIAANTPWVTIACPGCTFLMPKAVEPVTRMDGKIRATVWTVKTEGEEFGVRCTEGETVEQIVKLTMNWAEAKGATQQKLPGGTVEIALPGSLTRVTPQPKGKRVCMVNAFGTTQDPVSTDARRFVESFSWSK